MVIQRFFDTCKQDWNFNGTAPVQKAKQLLPTVFFLKQVKEFDLVQQKRQ